MVCPWGFPLSVRSCGNQRTRHRYQVNTRLSCPVLMTALDLSSAQNFSFFVLYFSIQLLESVGSCLWCTWASCPAEGAIGLFYRPAIQGHWERSQFYLSLAVFFWSQLFLSQLNRFAIVWVFYYLLSVLSRMPLLWLCNRCSDLNKGQKCASFVSSLCRNGRLSKLWGLWTFSASKLM